VDPVTAAVLKKLAKKVAKKTLTSSDKDGNPFLVYLIFGVIVFGVLIVAGAVFLLVMIGGIVESMIPRPFTYEDDPHYRNVYEYVQKEVENKNEEKQIHIDYKMAIAVIAGLNNNYDDEESSEKETKNISGRELRKEMRTTKEILENGLLDLFWELQVDENGNPKYKEEFSHTEKRTIQMDSNETIRFGYAFNPFYSLTEARNDALRTKNGTSIAVQEKIDISGKELNENWNYVKDTTTKSVIRAQQGTVSKITGYKNSIVDGTLNVYDFGYSAVFELSQIRYEVEVLTETYNLYPIFTLRDNDLIIERVVKEYGLKEEEEARLRTFVETTNELYNMTGAGENAGSPGSEGRDGFGLSLTLQEYLIEIRKETPMFLQYDPQWGTTMYSSINNPSQTIASSACGPVSFAMVLSHFNKISEIEDSVIKSFQGSKIYRLVLSSTQYALENGFRTAENGTATKFLESSGEAVGLKVEYISQQNAINRESLRIKSHLESGKPIIASMGPGNFTQSGHYILLSGMKDNVVIVNDPNSEARSNQGWRLETILSESNHGFWLYSQN
jgi:hypothetical protein